MYSLRKNDVYISFCVFYTFHKTVCILEKKMGLSIYLEELGRKYITQLSIYSAVLVGSGDLRIFSVEDVLNTCVENEYRTQLVAPGPGMKIV